MNWKFWEKKKEIDEIEINVKETKKEEKLEFKIDTRGKPKFSSEEKLKIVSWVAQYWSDKEIKKAVQEDFKKDISKRLIEAYRQRPKWQSLISRYREQYEKEILRVPLTSKRKRVEELQKLFDKSVDVNKVAQAQSIIRDFREEMEGKTKSGDSYYIQVNQQNEFNSLSDEELVKMKLKDIENLERIRKIRSIPKTGEEIIDATDFEGDEDSFEHEENLR